MIDILMVAVAVLLLIVAIVIPLMFTGVFQFLGNRAQRNR